MQPLLCYILVTRKDLQIHINKTLKFKFNKKLVRKILHIGIPSGLENSMFQLGKILVLSLVASFGTSAIAQMQFQVVYVTLKFYQE